MRLEVAALTELFAAHGACEGSVKDYRQLFEVCATLKNLPLHCVSPQVDFEAEGL